MHASALNVSHTCVHTYTSYIRTYTQINMYDVRIYTHTNAHDTYTQTHIHMHMHIHMIHMHTYKAGHKNKHPQRFSYLEVIYEMKYGKAREIGLTLALDTNVHVVATAKIATVVVVGTAVATVQNIVL